MDIVPLLLIGILICLICMSSSPILIIAVLFGCVMIYFVSSIIMNIISTLIYVAGLPIRFVIYNIIWWGDRIMYNSSQYLESIGCSHELIIIYSLLGLFVICISLISCGVRLGQKYGR